MSKLHADRYIDVKLDMDDYDLTAAERKATYEELKAFTLKKHKIKVSTLYIAQVKKKYGIDLRAHYNISTKENQKIPQCPPEKEEAIVDALRYYKMI